MGFRYQFVVALQLAVWFAAGCSEEPDRPAAEPASGPADHRPMVLASNYAIAFLAYRISGDEVRVVYPVPVETAPHEWKPGVAEMNAMRGARLVLAADREETPWVRVLAGVPVPVADLVDPLHGATEHPDGLSEQDALVAAFLEPAAVEKVAARIANALGQLYPPGKEGFNERANNLGNELATREARWNDVHRHLDDKPLLALGPAIAPWAKRCGLPVTVVTNTYEIEQAVVAKPAKHILVTEPLSDFYRAEFANRGLVPLILDPGLRKPAQGDFLGLLDANLALLEPAGTNPAATASAVAQANPSAGFEESIVPLLDKYCVSCHDADTNEGEIDFEVFFTESKAVHKLDLWEDVAALLEMRDMPPRKEKKQPTDAERERIVAWVHDLENKWTAGAFGKDPGKTTLRRINKNEYNYTIRDLFGIRLRPADNFPEESGGEAGFDNTADALFLPALLMENYVEASGQIVMAVYTDRALLERYLFAPPGNDLTPGKSAKRILEYWATRAYRRPVRKDELDRLVSIYERESRKKKKFAEAMKMPLVAILISPNFLYRAEAEEKKAKPYRIGAYDLASRLSYFLWSSMPDDELIALAKDGSLLKPEVTEAQVLRMLADEKARSLSMHFAGQWFGWEELRSTANPDKVKYPEFSFDLRVDLYRESAAFFTHLLETNASALDLLDSEYTFLNERLARHYGIPGVRGAEIRKVALNNPNRGGVLGMGSVLTATSLPLRSSPAARGDYVLTEILGTPTPEPPMDVAMLPDDDREIETKTFREALEQHRSDPNCKGCHEAIDPLGFGMENFDAIGRWRTAQNGNPLDTNGVLPDGREFSQPSQLKKILIEDKKLFAKNMSRKALTYALGRELTPYDLPAVRKIANRLAEDNYRIHTAFLEVAKSYPFQYRRNDDYKPAP